MPPPVHPLNLKFGIP